MLVMTKMPNSRLMCNGDVSLAEATRVDEMRMGTHLSTAAEC